MSFFLCGNNILFFYLVIVVVTCSFKTVVVAASTTTTTIIQQNQNNNNDGVTTGNVESDDKHHLNNNDIINVNIDDGNNNDDDVDDNMSSNIFFIQNRRHHHHHESKNHPACNSDSGNGRGEALECWLYGLELHIPNQEFNYHFLSLQLSNFLCTNFTLGQIDSHYHDAAAASGSSSKTKKNPQLQVSVQEMNAQCTGNYRVTPGFSGMIHASVSKDTDTDDSDDDNDDNAFEITWDIESSPAPFKLPTTINTTDCDLNLAITDLYFTGSISADIVDYFKGRIANYISYQLQENICPIVFDETVDDLANEYLAKLNSFIKTYLPITTTTTTTTMQPEEESTLSRLLLQQEDKKKHGKIIDFGRDTPILVKGLDLINDHIFTNHLHQGFLVPWFEDDNNDDDNSNKMNDKEIDCGLFFRGVSGLIKSFLYEPDDSSTTTTTAIAAATHDDNDNVKFIQTEKDDSPLVLNIPLPKQVQELTWVLKDIGVALHLNISSIVLDTGLVDNIEQFQLFQPRNQTLTSTLHSSKGFSLRINANVNMSSTSKHDNNNIIHDKTVLQETFQFRLNVTDIIVNFPLLLEIERDSFLNISTDTFTGFDHGPSWSTKIISCILASIQSMTIGSSNAQQQQQELLQFHNNKNDMVVQVKLADASIVPIMWNEKKKNSRMLLVKEKQQQHSLEEDLDEFINTFMKLLLKEYQWTITQFIMGFMKYTNTGGGGKNNNNDDAAAFSLLDTINTFVTKQIKDYTNDPNHQFNCSKHHHHNHHKPRWLNFTKISILNVMNRLLHKSSTLQQINRFLDCTTSYIIHHEVILPPPLPQPNKQEEEENLLPSTITTTRTTNNEHSDIGAAPSRSLTSSSTLSSKEDDNSIQNKRMSFVLQDFQVQNIGTVNEIEFLKPSDEFNLVSTFQWGKKKEKTTLANNNNEKKDFGANNGYPTVVTSFRFDLYPLLNISGDVNISASIGNVRIHSENLIKYDMNQAKKMSLKDYLSPSASHHSNDTTTSDSNNNNSTKTNDCDSRPGSYWCTIVPLMEYDMSNVKSSIDVFNTNILAKLNFGSAQQKSKRFNEVDNNNSNNNNAVDGNTTSITSVTPITMNFTLNENSTVFFMMTDVLQWYLNVIQDSTTGLIYYIMGHKNALCYGKDDETHQDINNDDKEDEDEEGEFQRVFFTLCGLFLLVQPIILMLVKEKSNETATTTTTRETTNNNGTDEHNSQDNNNNNNSLMEPLLPLEETEHLVVEGEERQQQQITSTQTRQQDSSSSSTPCHHYDYHSSLVHSPAVPVFFRYFLPVFIVGTIALLFASNLSVGASVDMFLSLDLETTTVDNYLGSFISSPTTITLPSLFEFSLGNTISEMWEAKIYALFFLVVVFSGIWPYTKLFLMLFAWITPTATIFSGNNNNSSNNDDANTDGENRENTVVPRLILTTRKRERLLLALDALGKFSLVDIYVCVLMIVAFRYHLDLFLLLSSAMSNNDNDDDDVIGKSEEIHHLNNSLDVIVSPHFGFYGFIFATCSSLVIGHLLVFFHRKSQRYNNTGTTGNRTEMEQIDLLGKESLFDHQFKMNNGERRQLSRWFQVFLVACTITTIVLLGVGMAQKSFVFEFGGIAGKILENPRSEYSLLSIGTSLSDSVISLHNNETTSTMVYLQAVYFFYAVITPFACLVLLLVLLMCPMTYSIQYALITLIEIANAWSAIEVFVLSIIAALFQIATFASFIIGDKCDLINEIFKDYEHYFHHHNTTDNDMMNNACYTVEASVVFDNAWILIAGVILNSFIVSLLLRFAHVVMEERSEQEAFLYTQIMEKPHENDNNNDTNNNGGDNHNNDDTIVGFLYRWGLINCMFASSSYGNANEMENFLDSPCDPNNNEMAEPLIAANNTTSTTIASSTSTDVNRSIGETAF